MVGFPDHLEWISGECCCENRKTSFCDLPSGIDKEHWHFVWAVTFYIIRCSGIQAHWSGYQLAKLCSHNFTWPPIKPASKHTYLALFILVTNLVQFMPCAAIGGRYLQRWQRWVTHCSLQRFVWPYWTWGIGPGDGLRYPAGLGSHYSGAAALFALVLDGRL